jgi:hypothetical protein
VSGTALLEIWFSAWNADNRKARAAYYRLREEQDTVRLCKKDLHLMTPDNQKIDDRGWVNCLTCYREKNRRNQRAWQTRKRAKEAA